MNPVKISSEALAARYSDAPRSMQQIIAGFTLYEAYKGDQDFITCLEIDTTIRGIYFAIKELKDNVKYNLEPAIPSAESPQKATALKTAIKYHEERVEELLIEYKSMMQELIKLSAKFGFEHFRGGLKLQVNANI